MSACAKTGGKSLDRGSVFGAMSQLLRYRMCVELRNWFAMDGREAKQAVKSTSLQEAMECSVLAMVDKTTTTAAVVAQGSQCPRCQRATKGADGT